MTVKFPHSATPALAPLANTVSPDGAGIGHRAKPPQWAGAHKNGKQFPPGQLLGAGLVQQQQRQQRLQHGQQFPGHALQNAHRGSPRGANQPLRGHSPLAHGRRQLPPRAHPAEVMTSLLGMPAPRSEVFGLAKEIHGVNDRIKFGAKSMASLGIYPLVKVVQGLLAGVPIRSIFREMLAKA